MIIKTYQKNALDIIQIVDKHIHIHSQDRILI